MPTTGATPLTDQCALQDEGRPCGCGRLRPGCPHLIQVRAHRMIVILNEGVTAARARELAVAVRALEGVSEVRFR